ncbi:hypothetical protein SDC9_188444 [bioreactor metagenome]|uniref:Uncharacterized protein n=1 Tax=bioreactor metagenome TaxID=1076179 RepID=A0A645HXL0_9ZZZZ
MNPRFVGATMRLDVVDTGNQVTRVVLFATRVEEAGDAAHIYCVPDAFAAFLIFSALAVAKRVRRSNAVVSIGV